MIDETCSETSSSPCSVLVKELRLTGPNAGQYTELWGLPKKTDQYDLRLVNGADISPNDLRLYAAVLSDAVGCYLVRCVVRSLSILPVSLSLLRSRIGPNTIRFLLKLDSWVNAAAFDQHGNFFYKQSNDVS